MRDLRQIKRWTKLLEKLGYRYGFRYPGNQLVAIDRKTGEEIPIEITDEYGTISADKIVATEKVLNELKMINRYENCEPNDPEYGTIYRVKTKKVGRRYKPVLEILELA